MPVGAHRLLLLLLALGPTWMRTAALTHRHRLASLLGSRARLCATASASVVRTPKPKPSTPLAVTAWVDNDILDWASIKYTNRKSKILVSTKTRDWTLESIRKLVATKFPTLENQPYKLRYNPAAFGPNTTLETFKDDANLNAVFAKYADSGRHLQIFVQANPGVFPPPRASDGANTSALIESSAKSDPMETRAYTFVSFYAFADIQDPSALSEQFRRSWEPFKALGRIYVAKEGVNAQMAVPSNAFQEFMQATRQYPFFSNVRFNVDHEMTREDYIKSKPFRNLHIRVRKQIVADGLDETLDWTKAGTELLPLDWHRHISAPNALILDCRNTYETDVGKFENALPLNTTVFRESWDAMEEILRKTPKDAPVYTYCTGGIRCVKINAFLEQKMGFTNTYRLKGGVIYYTKTLEHVEAGKGVDVIDPTLDYRKPEQDPQNTRHIDNSKFLGVNYVFDDRMGARVTQDVFTGCGTCGETCDSFTNCLNFQCNVLYIQCSKCRTRYGNCCSKACEAQYLAEVKRRARFAGKCGDITADVFATAPKTPQAVEQASAPTGATVQALRTHAKSFDAVSEAMGAYCEQHSVAEAPLLAALRQHTVASFEPALSRMISGPSQGALLSMLATVSRAKSVLELGAFTGYSSLCLAADIDHWATALTEPGILTSEQLMAARASSREVHTCEVEAQYADVAESFFRRCVAGEKVPFLPAVAASHSPFTAQITLHRQAAAEAMNQFRQQGRQFDLVFVDANKKSYLAYLQDLLGGDGKAPLVQPGGLIVVDNTLWKGLVLRETAQWRSLAPNPAEFGAAQRMAKIAEAMHELNEFCAKHPNLRALQLPMRDGLTILRVSA